MNVFEAVKQSVTTRQAAERYGIKVNRNGMCACPFHNDKNPSMKVDRRFYCFGCGATGDVIDFVSRLHGIGSREAALMLAQDFSINEIMNQCVTGWNYFSNPRMFAGYGRQKGWERENARTEPATDSGNGTEKIPEGFTPVPEQMELPF